MKNSSQKTFAMWAIFIVLAIVLIQNYQQKNKSFIKDFDYNKFRHALTLKHVKNVTFEIAENDSIGEISGSMKKEFKTKYKGAVKFKVQGDISAQGRLLVEKNGLTPNYKKIKDSLFVSLLLSWLPFIFLIFIFMFFFKQMQSGGSKIMSFGKSKAKMMDQSKNKITFKDVAGVEEAKDDLVEIVEFLKDPKKFTNMGARIPKGVLLVGPPGTGKTLLAKAMAGEADAPFFTISGSDFVEMFVGVGASRVRDLFEQGKKHAPCVIFIDEIDAVGRHRGSGMGGGHDEREQTLNQLLVEMDGFEFNNGVIVLAATNRLDVLDPALLRPGRFDRSVMVPVPDLTGREQVLNIYVNKLPKEKLASNINLEKVARGTTGFSGADLANLVNEAALRAARLNKKQISMEDLEQSRDKILMGSERKSMKVNDKDKKITAYHEAGHAIVGKLLPQMDPIHKISIIPRGRALGVTQTLPKEEELNMTKIKAHNLLSFLFGGRVAEELIFKDFTTGASNDIERATDLARKIICEWGMNDKIGPVNFGKSDQPVFVGMQSGGQQKYSDKKAEEIDNEISSLISDAKNKTTEILKENENLLHTLAKALLKFETIDSKEFELIMNGENLDKIEIYREEQKRILKQEEANSEKIAKAEEVLKEEKPKAVDVNLQPKTVS
ncbi:MAG: ATP-dependent zinc metalloprotease FtsH [Bdellovibrionales bacterium]|nr:ATP-dependent zinc metalloprotease FtsH [Bdellovibrionales bacterium]